MRIALALAILLIPFSAPAQEASASLAGAVVDMTGAYIAHAAVVLDSGTRHYRVQTDEMGAYQFSNLQAGEYTLTFRMVGFKRFTLKSIGLMEREQKRISDVPLDVGNCGIGSPPRNLVLLVPGDSFGRLTGSVTRPAKGVEVTLVCRTFTACRSTQTDSKGRYSFDMLSPGVYGLNFRRNGFYPENATGYSYYVNAGWESIYSPLMLERCPNGNCDPKLRPQRPVAICE
jgi:Carboxypeptidase regulatory-like domain